MGARRNGKQRIRGPDKELIEVVGMSAVFPQSVSTNTATLVGLPKLIQLKVRDVLRDVAEYPEPDRDPLNDVYARLRVVACDSMRPYKDKERGKCLCVIEREQIDWHRADSEESLAAVPAITEVGPTPVLTVASIPYDPADHEPQAAEAVHRGDDCLALPVTVGNEAVIKG